MNSFSGTDLRISSVFDKETLPSLPPAIDSECHMRSKVDIIEMNGMVNVETILVKK